MERGGYIWSAGGFGTVLRRVSADVFSNGAAEEACNLRVGSEAHPCAQSLKRASVHVCSDVIKKH